MAHDNPLLAFTPPDPDAQPEPRMRIGIDFDNTLAGYDEVFLSTARTMGLVGHAFCGGKSAIRDHLHRHGQHGDWLWQHLQGRVYGAEMAKAVLIEGAREFLIRCRNEQVQVFVVSHKTMYGHHDPARVNLRDAALKWMTAQGFFAKSGFGLAREQVVFESTRKEKVAQIASLRCDIFIDDLEEVLLEPTFPPDVLRILFAPHEGGCSDGILQCSSWAAISELVFDGVH
jgi:hypothetical protein